MKKDDIILLNEKIKKEGKIVVKRNGRRINFDGEKIALAVKKAFEAQNKIEEKYLASDVSNVYKKVLEEILIIDKENIKVEEIQDIIEKKLDELKYKDIKNLFSEYREKRAISRKMFNDQRREHKFSSVYGLNINKEFLDKNPNFLMKKTPNEIYKDFGKKISEQFAKSYILKRKTVEAVDSGEIFIHDISAIPLGNISSVMLNLDKIMEIGLKTGIGKYRSPKNVLSYSILTYNLATALKKEMSGYVGIPFLDKYFSKIFVKNFKKEFLEYINIFLEYTDFKKFVALNSINSLVSKIESVDIDVLTFKNYIRSSNKVMEIINLAYIKALLKSEKILYKGLEALVHNLNNSVYRNIKIKEEDKNRRKNLGINIGTCRNVEGLIVSKTLLDIIKNGIGDNISPFEPNIYLAVTKEDLKKAKEKIKSGDILKANKSKYIEEEDLNQLIDYKEKNEYILKRINSLDYSDLLIYAMKISKYRENIYFSFTNEEDLKNEKDFKYLMEDMAVSENEVDPKKASPEGRGILSTTTINLPRIAIKSAYKKDFFEELLEKIKIVENQLFDRFIMQCDLDPGYFSTLYSEGVWIDSDKINKGDRLRKVLKHGNMNIGITGLYEAAKILVERRHKNTLEKQKLKENILNVSEEILKFIQKNINEFKIEKNINLNIYADDEASNHFIKLDRALYGKIKGITDKEKYEKGTNYPNEKDLDFKLKYEGIMQKYTKGGNLTRLKLDKNIKLEEYIDILQKAIDNNIKLLKIIFE